MPLLVLGTLLGIAAQLIFLTAEKDQRSPPADGIAALLASIAFIALGTFFFALSKQHPECFKDTSTQRFSCTDSSLSPHWPSWWTGGVVVFLFLVFQLLRGSQSPWTLLPWIGALGMFAVPFLPHPRPTFQDAWARIRYVRDDALIVTAFTAFFIGVNSWDLNHWYYSVIGDEGVFWTNTVAILDHGFSRPFDQDGVYGDNPMLNIGFKALVMLFAGQSHVGLAFSSVLAGAACIPGIYLVVRATVGSRTPAIVAIALFSFSHYVYAYAHTLYINLDTMVPAVYAFAFLLFGLRRRVPFLLYLAGIAAGLGFYTYLSARAIMPIILVFLLLSPHPVKSLRDAWPVFLGFLFTVIPVFIVNGKQAFEVMSTRLVLQDNPDLLGEIWRRVIENIPNLFLFNYNIHGSHFVTGPFLDYFSGLLAILGVGYALGAIRQSSSRLLLIWFGAALVGSGLLSQHGSAPISRMHFALPPLFIMAGLMVGQYAPLLAGRLLNSVRGRTTRTELLHRVTPPAIIVAALLMALFLNVWQFWVVTPAVIELPYRTTAMQAFRSDACGSDIWRTVFIGEREVPLERYYPSGPQARTFKYDDSRAMQDLLTSAAQPRCIIVTHPHLPAAAPILSSIEQRYPNAHRSEVSNPAGKRTVVLYTVPQSSSPESNG